MFHFRVRRHHLPKPEKLIPSLLALLIAAAPIGAFAQDASPVSGASQPSQTAQAPADFFSDVPSSSWAYAAVKDLADKGYLTGYPDKTYKGGRPLTRYELAIVVERLADGIEKQLVAGKTVESTDTAALHKLLQEFGTEIASIQNQLKALKQEADATQKQADATQKEADATQQQVAGHTGQIGALQDVNRRVNIKLLAFVRTFAYGANINANCSPLGRPTPGTATSVATYCNNTIPGNALLQGTRTASYLQAPDGAPQSSFVNGQRNAGQTYDFQQISFTGSPGPNSLYNIQFGAGVRPSSSTGTSTASVYCLPQQNFLNGNAAEPATLTSCTSSTASQASYSDGLQNWFPTYQNVWIQQSIPQSGLYVRAGHIQMLASPYSPQYIGGDYLWGGQVGINHGPFDAYFAFGAGNSAATNLTLDNVPWTHSKVVAEADYALHVGRGQISVTGMYENYSGGNSTLWDPAAVMCTGTGAAAGGVRYFANTAAVPFTTCGAGYNPITYTSGAPITGAYLSQANNNPTLTLLTAGGTASFITPGLATSVNQTGILGGVTADFGKLHASLSGSAKLGNDPYTGKPWLGNLSGAWLLDYGPWRAGTPGNRGHFTYETQGYAMQFNGYLSNQYPTGSSALSNSWTTNFGGQYWAEAGVKYWTGDNTYLNVGFGHTGLLPNTNIPASGTTCPGCVISGLNQNAAFLEYLLNF